jgi:hypothetical protein
MLLPDPRGYRGSGVDRARLAFHGFVACSCQGPPQQNEARPTDPEKQPIVEPDVNRKIADVVQGEQVMVNDPFDQVEQPPPENEQAREGLAAG